MALQKLSFSRRAPRLFPNVMNTQTGQPLLEFVSCPHPEGQHRMAYWRWGDVNARRLVVCAHGLTRQGRDFDRLAQALVSQSPQALQIICPDVVGRGRSDWLADPMGYQLQAYVADMVTLLARLDAVTVHWLGTSMGGLIGLGLAALPGSPVSRLVLNDVGPTIEPASLQRIGQYLGQPAHWATEDEAADALWAISTGFGPHSRAQWLALTRPQLKADGDGFTLRCDPAIALPFRLLTP
ncbi:MAG: hypothetical protein RJB17_2364, partial [Pseudomonadota bacterium]